MSTTGGLRALLCIGSFRGLDDNEFLGNFQRLDAETNADRRVLIAGFPAKFANVATSLRAFVAKAFGPDAAGKAPLLRGVYFASGTQEGSPIAAGPGRQRDWP